MCARVGRAASEEGWMRRDTDSLYGPPVAHTYPPLNLQVRTPRLVLAGATDELLEQLIPVVCAGVVAPGRCRSTTRCRCTRTVLAANGSGCEVSGRGARTWTG